MSYPFLSPIDTPFLCDPSDHSKLAQFLCSSISTGTTRSFTLPDNSGTIALLSDVVLAGDIIPIVHGGTGQITAGAAFNALSPLAVEGDLLYCKHGGNTALAVGTTGQYLTSDGTDPLWGTLTLTNATNQGTTATVLHGNASGAVSFGAVSLAADVSGILPVANGGTGASTVQAGTTAVDFGAAPGSAQTSVAVTGQTAIGSGSIVEAWLVAVATSDHSADEHVIEPIAVRPGNISNGVGFTIYAAYTGLDATNNNAAGPLYGQYTVNWRWV